MSLNGKDTVTGKFDRIAGVTPGGAVLVTLVGAGDTTPPAGTASIATVTTSATGATWVPLASAPCQRLDLVNMQTAAVDIEYRRGGAGSAVPVAAGTGRMVTGITNASQISVRRIDQSSTQVTVSYEVFA